MVTFWCLIGLWRPVVFSTMYSARGSASGKEPAPCTATLSGGRLARATQTLTEVAEALVSNVDAPLRAYAA